MEIGLNDFDSEVAAKVYMLNSMVIKESFHDPRTVHHPGVRPFHHHIWDQFY